MANDATLAPARAKKTTKAAPKSEAAMKENARVQQMLAEQAEGGVKLVPAGTNPETGEPIFKPAPTQPAIPPGWPGSQLPTMIRLRMRPAAGEAFAKRFDEAAEAAGLRHPRRSPIGSIAYVHWDTRQAIAWLTPNKGHQHWTFREVVVEIDPEHCPVLRGSGTALFTDRLKALAKSLGGAHIHDDLGKKLGKLQLAAIAEHIDSVMVRRHGEEEAARTERIDTQTFRRRGDLSFQNETYIKGPRGGWKGYQSTRFDAPALHVYEGYAAGCRMAKEHVEWINRHDHSDAALGLTLREAHQILRNERRSSYNKRSRYFAAWGYIEIIDTLAKIGAKYVNMAWLDQQIDRYDKEAVRWRADRAKEIAERQARLQAGKAKKKAMRQGGAA